MGAEDMGAFFARGVGMSAFSNEPGSVSASGYRVQISPAVKRSGRSAFAGQA
jgi:hypothetical protein